MVSGFLEKLPIRSRLAKLIICSTLVALAISLGMIGILKLVSFHVNYGVPAVIGVIGAVTYAVKSLRTES